MLTKNEVIELSKNYGAIDLLIACIMRNNGASYEDAEEIALRLNGSDCIFDRFIDEYIMELEEERLEND